MNSPEIRVQYVEEEKEENKGEDDIMSEEFGRNDISE